MKTVLRLFSSLYLVFKTTPGAAVCRNPDFVSQFHFRVAGVSVIHFRVVRRVLSCGRAGPRGAMCQRRGRPWAWSSSRLFGRGVSLRCETGNVSV
jgi:hypothetical protein